MKDVYLSKNKRYISFIYNHTFIAYSTYENACNTFNIVLIGIF